MSRIHEALKKAEQERLLSGAATAPVPSIEAPMPPATPVVDDLARESMPAVLPASVQTALAEMTGAGGGTDNLLNNCRQVRWNPDLSKMLFFGKDNHQAIGSEEFRTLRSKLYQIRAKQALRTILVSSALPGEGKSFVASNLAQVIVRQQGRKALLIDADLRWSRLHDYLGAPLEPGLTDYLRGSAKESDVIQRGQLQNLYFLPGGKPSQNPAELISSGRLKALLERMASIFDWIIIDSPPAVPVSDASTMADMCDGVLLVVQSDVTPLDMAQKARQEFANKPLLGVVLNQVADKKSSSSYYYYYGGYGKEMKKREKADREGGPGEQSLAAVEQ
jgi:capsular exopolysaccharide synthesis family protein